MITEKPYDQLTIRDYFMFGKICSDPKNRKLILDSLLQIDYQEKTGDIEKHVQHYKETKFAKLDLLVEDTSGKIYNAEMQNESKNKERQRELPKRSRYYQSLLDSGHLESGESYLKLPETFIIFICTFDPFGKNIPIYTFDTKCNEIDLPKYNDQAHKIFFNTTADLSKLPQTQRNMLQYFNDGVAYDSATQLIDSAVKEAQLKEEWKEEYMLTFTYQNEIYADGFSEGHAEGLTKGQLLNLVSIIIKKANKHKSLDVIADETEEDIDYIRPIYNTIIANPDKSSDEIYNILHENEK